MSAWIEKIHTLIDSLDDKYVDYITFISFTILGDMYNARNGRDERQ
ncbi:hypothetical protein ABEW60_12235 [Paenibacillus jamilae]